MPILTPELCHAARALVKADQALLSETSGFPLNLLRRFESGIETPPQCVLSALKSALEELGAVFLPEDGNGAGVRLKFDREERQEIVGWEGEGGSAADDNVI
jgi:hypothetical protein